MTRENFRKYSGTRTTTVALLCGVLYCTPSTAYAYVDPNTAGYVFQLIFPIVSAIAALCLFFKNQTLSLIRKITGLFGKKNR